MSNLFRDIFSRKAEFQDLFSRVAKNMVEMSKLLILVIETDDDNAREALFKQIKSFETAGDDVTHKIYLVLDKVRFSPLNRKDVHALASAIDDVADNIHEASGRMQLYRPQEYLPSFRQLAVFIKEACEKLEEIISSLFSIKNLEKAIAECKEIKKLEHEADAVYYRALADLFANEKDAIELIKYRDILHSLETSVNKCKSVTDMIELSLINSL